MQYRILGRTGMRVSAIGFGAWAIGSAWGEVDDRESMRALHAAADAGVNFFDTADVYGDGRSERLIAQLRRERPGETLWVATKAGRRILEQKPEGYTREQLDEWVGRSLKNLEVDAIDLLQLHCPHTLAYDRPELFGLLDDLVADGRIRYYGVSVQTVDEALRAMRHPGVQSIQVIFNAFRQKPIEQLFPAALTNHVGIIARVPLASGLLTGKFTRTSRFAPDDHRHFNRDGAAFDKGETFSGVPFEVGLAAADALAPLVPTGATLGQFALRWILMHEAVTTAIPGAKNPGQASDNTAAAGLPDLDPETMAAVREVYDRFIREYVHGAW